LILQYLNEHNALRAIKAKPISVSTSDMEIL